MCGRAHGAAQGRRPCAAPSPRAGKREETRRERGDEAEREEGGWGEGKEVKMRITRDERRGKVRKQENSGRDKTESGQ